MEFYELTDETDTFHIPWYRKEGDAEVCGHNQLPLSYETDQTCGYYKERYKGNEEWLSSVNCVTSGFMKLVLKSKQHLSRSFSHFVVKFSCLYKRFLLFTVQWKLVALILPQNYLLKPTF